MSGNAFNIIAAHRGTVFVLIGAVIVIGIIWISFASRRPPYRRGRFLSTNEKQFIHALDGALSKNYRVFAQVRLADLVDVAPGAKDARRHAAMRKVFGKSIDFVICDALTLDPVAAIEVDDRSHLLAHRQERDAFVNAVFKEIRLPLVRAAARRNYTPAMMRDLLANAGVECREQELDYKSKEFT